MKITDFRKRNNKSNKKSLSTHSEVEICKYDGCSKIAKYEVTFLDHLWDKWYLCEPHGKEIKKAWGSLTNPQH